MTTPLNGKYLLMKRMIPVMLLMTAVFSMASLTAVSQPADSLTLYKKFPFIPSFQLMKADSSMFYMKDAIPKKTVAVVIIFSPACSHCQHQAQEITSHMQALANVHFLFATGYPLNEMKQFISDQGLDRFPNIVVGQDKGQNLGSFYQIRGLPGIFVYNKKGELVAEFNTNVSADILAEAIKK